MKITKITLNVSTKRILTTGGGQDCVFVLFRTPVSLKDGNSVDSGASASILYGTSPLTFAPADGKEMRFDIVRFRTTSADRQYMASMELPMNSLAEIPDSISIINILHSMKERLLSGGRYLSEYMELAMRMIFICICDSNASRTSDIPEISRYKELKELRDSIYDDPLNDWSVSDICSSLGISRTYFHRMYMQAFGVTCRQDVIESRLLRAEELLRSTDMSVSEISEECGYESESYFMRQFRAKKGCTPTEFRRINK